MSQKPAESVGSQRSRYRSFDEEAGGSRENDSDDDDLDDDAFDIPSKNAPVQSLKRWRVCDLINVIYIYSVFIYNQRIIDSIRF